MKFFIIMLLFLSSLRAVDGEINLYHETLNSNQKSSIESLYAELKQENIPTDFGVNYNLSLSATTPLYTQNLFYESIESKAIVNSASLDYYNNQIAISLGRNSLNLRLLNGNFDGAVYYQIYNHFSLRAFYFFSYEILLPTFYTKYDSLELKGVNLSYENRYLDIKATAINDKIENMYHTNFALKYNNYAISFESAYYDSDDFLSEDVKKISFSRYKEPLFLEFGVIKSGDNGINQLLKFEQDELNSFGLGNKIYMPNAQNNYIEIGYEKNSYYLNLLLGYTTYQKEFDAKEFDFSFEYNFSNQFNVDAHILREISSQGDTTLFSSSLNYRFEL